MPIQGCFTETSPLCMTYFSVPWAVGEALWNTFQDLLMERGQWIPCPPPPFGKGTW